MRVHRWPEEGAVSHGPGAQGDQQTHQRPASRSSRTLSSCSGRQAARPRPRLEPSCIEVTVESKARSSVCLQVSKWRSSGSHREAIGKYRPPLQSEARSYRLRFSRSGTDDLLTRRRRSALMSPRSPISKRPGAERAFQHAKRESDFSMGQPGLNRSRSGHYGLGKSADRPEPGRAGMKKIKVLVTDDHAIVRDGVTVLLALTGDIEVVGEAAQRMQAVKRVEQLDPDIVLMDISMRSWMASKQPARSARSFPRTKVLVLTQFEDREYVFLMIDAGARASSARWQRRLKLASGIRSVFDGGSYLSPSVARFLVEEHQHRSGRIQPRPVMTTDRTRTRRNSDSWPKDIRPRHS